jgi:hypothetical protein
MAFETRFSEQEQVLLSSLPTLVGTVMTFAEGSGMSTIMEMMASSRSMLEGSKQFAGNEIISGILPNMTSASEAMAEAKELRTKVQSHLKAHEVDSKDELLQQVLSDCKKANELLQSKSTPQEAEEFKKWTLDIAESVAKAAKEGGFLIFGGTQISDGEKKLFTDIAEALNVERSLN